MPITYTYDPDKNILYETAEGDISLKDINDFRDALLNMSMKPGLRALSDYRTANVEIDFEEMYNLRHITREAVQTLDTVRLAIVAADDLGYGMARMYGSIIGDANFTIHVFRDIDSAREWLGVE